MIQGGIRELTTPLLPFDGSWWEDMSGDIAAVLKRFVSVISEGGPGNGGGNYPNHHLTSLLWSRAVLLVTAWRKDLHNVYLCSY
jgi:hypothetical protein